MDVKVCYVSKGLSVYGVCKRTRKVSFYIENFQVLSFDISMGLYLFPVKRKSDASLGFLFIFFNFFFFSVVAFALSQLRSKRCKKKVLRL